MAKQNTNSDNKDSKRGEWVHSPPACPPRLSPARVRLYPVRLFSVHRYSVHRTCPIQNFRSLHQSIKLQQQQHRWPLSKRLRTRVSGADQTAKDEDEDEDS